MEHHVEAIDGYDTAMYLSIAPAIDKLFLRALKADFSQFNLSHGTKQ